MKKTITLLALAFTAGSFRAQTVADFESFSLTANSSYSSASSTPFQTANAIFPFTWNSSFQYWSDGFSYTNAYDSVTAGYTNLFGVRAYKGYNNSSTYVIAESETYIKLKQPNNLVNGFYITNTTYDWKSMKSGDQFAKKFGGPTGNDPDYFGITIKGWYHGVKQQDTVNFYLADYRFTNNAQDYIVDTWQFVNTASIGPVDSLRFYFFSSDTSHNGINTPLFFGMDNFTTSTVTVQGIASQTADLNFTAAPNPFSASLRISLNDKATEAKAVVTDITGKVMHSEMLVQKENEISLDHLENGVYFLELSTGNQRTVKKIIKN